MQGSRVVVHVAVEGFFEACRGRELHALVSLNDRLERVLERHARGWHKPSADEAVLVAAAPWGPHGAALRWAEVLRASVASELSLPASVGIAATRFAARICARMARPRGILLWMEGHEDSLLGGLPVEELDELRDDQLARLREGGVRTLDELAKLEPPQARALMGTEGEKVLGLVRGADRLWASSPGGPRSDAIQLLCRRITLRLGRAHRKARALELRIVYEDGVSRERYALLAHPTAQINELSVAARRLFDILAIRPRAIAGLTLSATGLVAIGEQLELFPTSSPREIRAHFGRLLAGEGTGLTDRFGAVYPPETLFGGKTHEENPHADGDRAASDWIRRPCAGGRR